MKGRVTIRTAGVFFLLAAAVELVSIRVAVPLLGALRGGSIAGLYHAAFAAIFLTVGIGLWRAARWGAQAVHLSTVIYSLDRFRYVLDRPGREAELVGQLQGYPEIIEALGIETLLQVGTVLALLFVACWWGFALYIHVRRGYFQPAVGGPGA